MKATSKTKSKDLFEDLAIKGASWASLRIAEQVDSMSIAKRRIPKTQQSLPLG